MRSKKFNEVRPYTYWIKHLETGIKYVGLRYRNVKFKRTPLEDFGTCYFTTGKLKKQFKANPKSFKTKLLFTYDSIEEAIAHELELTKKIFRDYYPESGTMLRRKITILGLFWLTLVLTNRNYTASWSGGKLYGSNVYAVLPVLLLGQLRHLFKSTRVI
jgi:hypothetical protein